jgi:hypothetical protein
MRTVADYENLRIAVLSAEPAPRADVGMVRHRGLTSWLREPNVKPIAQQPCAGQDRTPGVDPAPATTELTRLIAGIVFALAAEPVHG